MKKVFKLIVITALVTGIVISAVGCSEFGIGQDIEANVFMFEAERQPPDISKVVFYVSLERTERTINGTDYLVSLKIDGKLVDSKTITVHETGTMEGAVSLTGSGREMNRMLSDLDEKYEQAKTNYEDFQNEMGWDLLRGELSAKSYDEIKRLQEKEEKLEMEVNKWKSLRNGTGVGWGNSLDTFCKKYISITVTRQQD